MTHPPHWTEFKRLLHAEAAILGRTPAATLIAARFWDTVLGCLIGLLGGVCLHSLRFCAVLGRQIRRLTPSRRVGKAL